jgi:hypothetical protein
VAVKSVLAKFRVELVRDETGHFLTVQRLPHRIRVGTSYVIPGGEVVRRRLPRAVSPEALAVDGRVLSVSDVVYLKPGAHVVRGLVPRGRNLIRDGSFEKGYWTNAINAGPAFGHQPSVNGKQWARQMPGGTDGGSALEVVSTGNRAAVFEPVQRFRGGLYYSISFGHLHVSGGQASFALVAERRTLLEQQLPDKDDWSHRSFLFRAPPGARDLKLYLYSNSTGERSVNLFDDVSIVRLAADPRLSVQFDVVPPIETIAVPAARGQGLALEPLPASPNLIEDGSFEKGYWTNAINAGPAFGHQPSVNGKQWARQVPGGTDGGSALEIVSTGNRAAVFARVREFWDGARYRVGFDYRHVSGGPASFALVTDGRALMDRRLPSSRKWLHHEVFVTAPPDAGKFDIYLYSNSTGESSVNVFDAVSVTRLPGDEFLLGSATSGSEGDVRLAAERISPTRYRVRVLGSSRRFLLTVRENYDSGWVARSESASIGSHFQTNGYANGWIVRNARPGTVIEIAFAPQRWADGSRVLSASVLGFVLVGVLGSALVARLRTRLPE